MPYGETHPSSSRAILDEQARAQATAAFAETYLLEVAATPAQRERVYGVRYQVYCEELTGYESKDRFPDRLEHNASDEHSIHLLVSRRADGAAIGTARLVLTDPADPTRPLPFEAACSDTLHPWALPEDAATRWSIAEISRYAILGRHRQHHDDRLSQVEREAQPMIAAAMGLLCRAVAEHVGLVSLFGVMDERFAGLSLQLGAHLTRIGLPTEFHGIRTPFSVDLSACPTLFPDMDQIAGDAVRRVASLLPNRAPALIGCQPGSRS